MQYAQVSLPHCLGTWVPTQLRNHLHQYHRPRSLFMYAMPFDPIVLILNTYTLPGIDIAADRENGGDEN